MRNGSSLGFEVGTGEAIGLDLSDKSGTYVVVDGCGKVAGEGKTALTQAGLRRVFGSRRPTRIAIEVGTHSPWVSRLLSDLGHEVIVANARQGRLISQSKSKNDRQDAELLARLARFDPQLLQADPAPRRASPS